MAQITLNTTGVASNGSLVLQSNGTNAAVIIDTSQNVGVGVTPSAWQTGANLKALQVGIGAAFFSDTNSAYLGQNVFQDSAGTSKYINTNFASKYQQSSSVHSWFTAASGTAGNAITFTQAMTLDASGGLKVLNTIGVGNATPSTSGAGITFPATQSASSNANTLDDYEEGTFTPTCTLTIPGTSSSGSAVGVYTKVGNLVTATGRITFTKGTGTGDVVLGGLPFTSTNTATYQNSGAISTDSVGVAGKTFAILLGANSTAPSLIAITQVGGAGAVAAAGDLGTSAGIRYTFSYQID